MGNTLSQYFDTSRWIIKLELTLGNKSHEESRIIISNQPQTQSLVLER